MSKGRTPRALTVDIAASDDDACNDSPVAAAAVPVGLAHPGSALPTPTSPLRSAAATTIIRSGSTVSTSSSASRRRPPLKVMVPVQAQESNPEQFISKNGTFDGGDFHVNASGLTVTTRSASSLGPDGTGPRSAGSAGTTPPSAVSRHSTTSTPSSSRAAAAVGMHGAASAAASSATAGSAAAAAAGAGSRRVDDPFGNDDDECVDVPAETAACEIQLEDLEYQGVIGRGAGGYVRKAIHRPTGRVVAVKTMPLMINEAGRKAVTTELNTLIKSNCSAIVTFYGAFYKDGSIYIVLEYMDGGSLLDLVRAVGCLPEPMLARMTTEMLTGLDYLHTHLRLLHRDVKPSNVLVNRRGQVKITDFGVSRQLSESLSKCASYTGTQNYMSPERIQGGDYGFAADIWGVGLSLIECARGRFPYPPPGAPQSDLTFWEMLDYIVKEPAPTLPAEQFSPELRDFVALCLRKDPARRPTARQLLEHPWLVKARQQPFDLTAWARDAVEKAAQRMASPSTDTLGESLGNALADLDLDRVG